MRQTRAAAKQRHSVVGTGARMSTALPDRPIESPGQDLLGRTRFASGLAALIANAPPRSSLRIGIYGGWGEGKTSVLQLIKRDLEERNHVCVWLTPWIWEDRNEIADALL